MSASIGKQETQLCYLSPCFIGRWPHIELQLASLTIIPLFAHTYGSVSHSFILNIINRRHSKTPFWSCAVSAPVVAARPLGFDR
jgi:hypothetical protein